ncbi:thylakoid lumenal 15.0 kDa protein 2, chloroplastic isoform X2 [Curcuma longa]|uniref:thylakoid lumenal 15.0 kDa protein 2, chloroplastic isoform X2 n=1 Tax=Curcuma longa TaxID=136217 RepID=UPI003D9E859E
MDQLCLQIQAHQLLIIDDRRTNKRTNKKERSGQKIDRLVQCSHLRVQFNHLKNLKFSEISGQEKRNFAVSKTWGRMISTSKGIMVALLPSPLPHPLPSAVKLQRSRAALPDLNKWGARLYSKSLNLAFTGALALGFALGGVGIADAKVGVNRPEMLPKEFSPVIDVAGFLSASQERQLCQEIADLEKDTGVKLRILAQNYPETPGAAVKEFWKVDDQTIVFVADPTFGNMLHFNVGASVDLDVPRSFWSRVAGKYGNMFYWKEKGEDASIEAAVVAISSCLREPTGANNCLEVN